MPHKGAARGASGAGAAGPAPCPCEGCSRVASRSHRGSPGPLCTIGRIPGHQAPRWQEEGSLGPSALQTPVLAPTPDLLASDLAQQPLWDGGTARRPGRGDPQVRGCVQPVQEPGGDARDQVPVGDFRVQARRQAHEAPMAPTIHVGRPRSPAASSGPQEPGGWPLPKRVQVLPVFWPPGSTWGLGSSPSLWGGQHRGRDPSPGLWRGAASAWSCGPDHG